MRDFLSAKDQWFPTWPQNIEDRAFVMYVQLMVPIFILLLTVRDSLQRLRQDVATMLNSIDSSGPKHRNYLWILERVYIGHMVWTHFVRFFQGFTCSLFLLVSRYSYSEASHFRSLTFYINVDTVFSYHPLHNTTCLLSDAMRWHCQSPWH